MGYIFIYSGSALLISFEINPILKEVNRAEPEYMNMHPPPRAQFRTQLVNSLVHRHVTTGAFCMCNSPIKVIQDC